MSAPATQAESLPGILPHHLRELRASGLTDETIIAAGIRSETSRDVISAILHCRASKRAAPAIVFPYYDADGKNGYSRIKPDTPRTDPTSGKPVKYESPRNVSNRIYLPTNARRAAAAADGEVFITEGEKKAAAVDQLGFPCIGLVGVFGWKDKRHERLLPELDRIAWSGREVFIVFDSDIVRNPNVLDAESRLASQLKSHGATVRVVRLPEKTDAAGKPVKVGIDDHLVACGSESLREVRRLANEAQEPTPPDAGVLKRSANEIDPASEAERYLATGQLDGCNRLAFYRGEHFLYRRGRYETLHTAEVRADVVRNLNRSYSHLTTAVTANMMQQIQAQTLLPSTKQPPCWIAESPGWPAEEVLAARNGLVWLAGFADGKPHFIPPTPRFFTTAAIEYDFKPDALSPLAWLEFLRQLWGDDQEAIDTLQEWFGYCLTPDTSQQKILTLFGPKRSGKGTIARVLRGVVGTANVAGPTLASLGDRFGLWPLIGKSLAIFNDARLSNRSDQAVIVERLLSISGEDALTIDRKNLAPTTGKLSTRLMVISNELPRLGDASGALTSRLVVLQLRDSFYGREQSDLTDRLLNELPGVLLWAIEGWKRLRDRGRFHQPASGAELLGELDELGSPIGQFVRERCILDPVYRTPVSDLYHEWCQWCITKGIREPGIEQMFGRNLLAAVPELRRTRPQDEGARYRAYQGVAIVSGV